MVPNLTMLVALLAAPLQDLPTAVWPLVPATKAKVDGEPVAIEVTKPRVVLLVPGLLLQPLRPERITRPLQHDWQQTTSEIVRALAADSDVYAFGYAQTLPVDAIASSAGFRQAVLKFREAGYKEIV
ncbi:MAG: hypothetical protein ACRCZF_24815, partial [Gemmataceae bacterium]